MFCNTDYLQPVSIGWTVGILELLVFYIHLFCTLFVDGFASVPAIFT